MEETKMIEIGRICLKIAGRDAGKKCVVVDILDSNFVLVDGETRRRKCNIAHLEPLDQTLDIKKGDDHAKVVAAFKSIDIVIRERKSKPKAPPRKAKPVAKAAPVKAAKPKAAAPAKVEPEAKKKVVKKSVKTA